MFSREICKSFRAPFTEHLRWLLLKLNKTKHTHASAANLLHIRIANLDWNESHEEENKYIHASATDLLN